jgi:hypothetical protein
MIPGNSFGFVSICVNISSSLASLATKKTVQVGPGLVLATSFNSVALSTPLNKQLQERKVKI